MHLKISYGQANNSISAHFDNAKYVTTQVRSTVKLKWLVHSTEALQFKTAIKKRIWRCHFTCLGLLLAREQQQLHVRGGSFLLALKVVVSFVQATHDAVRHDSPLMIPEPVVPSEMKEEKKS